MEIIKGTKAIAMIEAICKDGGTFSLCFYRYSRSKGIASAELQTYHNCTLRKQLPHDKFGVDGVHYLLFNTSDGSPKMCYKVLIRFIGLPLDDFKLKKVIWYE